MNEVYANQLSSGINQAQAGLAKSENRQGSINAEVERLESALKMLGADVLQHGDVIAPICVPECNTLIGDGKIQAQAPEPMRCDLATRIRTATTTLQAITANIRALTNRVSLT